MVYTVYMSRYLTTGQNPGWETAKNIETAFAVTDAVNGNSTLKYKQMTGLSDKGKPRTYIESFADSSSIKAYISDKLENTELVLTLVFIGPARRTVYDNFFAYLKGYKLKYWDSVRKRKVEMFLSEAITPSGDLLYGGVPYIQADFKFTNYSGETTASESI